MKTLARLLLKQRAQLQEGVVEQPLVVGALRSNDQPAQCAPVALLAAAHEAVEQEDAAEQALAAVQARREQLCRVYC